MSKKNRKHRREKTKLPSQTKERHTGTVSWDVESNRSEAINFVLIQEADRETIETAILNEGFYRLNDGAHGWSILVKRGDRIFDTHRPDGCDVPVLFM